MTLHIFHIIQTQIKAHLTKFALGFLTSLMDNKTQRKKKQSSSKIINDKDANN